MAVTALCTQTDMQYILSVKGVLLRMDDAGNGSAETDFVDEIIEIASVWVNQHLFDRYATATIQASSWAKWAAAHKAVVLASKRRGNSVPESLLEELDVYIAELERIRDGKSNLMTDTGVATPTHDELPTVSNMTVDSRYTRNNVRRVKSSSTGDDAAAGVQQDDARTVGDFPWY